MTLVECPCHTDNKRLFYGRGFKLIGKLDDFTCWILFNNLLLYVLIVIVLYLALGVVHRIHYGRIGCPVKLASWVHHVLREDMTHCFVLVRKFHLKGNYRTE